MSRTPRTDAVFKAVRELPWGSVVEIPNEHPPCDPWKLSRSLEIEVQELEYLLREIYRSCDDTSPSFAVGALLIADYFSKQENKMSPPKVL